MRMPFLVSITALTLAACQPAETTAEAPTQDEPEATPAAPEPEAPAVPASAVAFLRTEAGEGDGSYAAASIDLNGDGVDEVVGYVMGPMWCGSGGCNAWVLTPDGDGWRVVTETSVTQTPIRVLETSTNGWRDLSVAIGGGGREWSQVRLTFDGTSYPTNPTVGGLEAVETGAGAELIPEGPGQPLP